MAPDALWLVLTPVLWGLAVYLLGSILCGDVIASRYGVDIWQVGTRNPGAANVARTVGVTPGIAVYVADVFVGAAAVLPAAWLPNADVTRVVGVAAVMLGTFYSVLWRFRGGAGLAKAMGVTLGLNPIGFLIAAPLGIALVSWSRNSGVSGGLTMGLVGALSLLLYRDYLAAALILLVGGVVWLRVHSQRMHKDA